MYGSADFSVLSGCVCVCMVMQYTESAQLVTSSISWNIGNRKFKHYLMSRNFRLLYNMIFDSHLLKVCFYFHFRRIIVWLEGGPNRRIDSSSSIYRYSAGGKHWTLLLQDLTLETENQNQFVTFMCISIVACVRGRWGKCIPSSRK